MFYPKPQRRMTQKQIGTHIVSLLVALATQKSLRAMLHACATLGGGGGGGALQVVLVV